MPQTSGPRRLRRSLFIAGVGVAVAVAVLSGVVSGIIRRSSDADAIPALPAVSPRQTPPESNRTVRAPDKPDGVPPMTGTGSSGPAVSSAPSSLCPTRIESPRGAEVSWKDRVAIVPTVLPLPCDIEVSLAFRQANHIDAIRKVTATAGGKPINVRLQRAISIAISSTPAGATILLGKKWLGVTPATIKLPVSSTSVLTLTKDGYEPGTQTITPANDDRPVHVTLSQRPAQAPNATP